MQLFVYSYIGPSLNLYLDDHAAEDKKVEQYWLCNLWVWAISIKQNSKEWLMVSR